MPCLCDDSINRVFGFIQYGQAFNKGVSMELKLDLSREYGIVLEGGGAKGAYQIGAWKALKEAGLKIKGVSGTSVGALNGALICMDNIEKAMEVWENISYSQVMSVEDEFMDGIIKKDYANLSAMEILKNSMLYLSNGGIDVTPLRDLINNHIDEDRLRSGKPEFYFQTFSVTELKELDIDATLVEDGQMIDMLLASAYFPVFKKEKVMGNRLIDGGMFNNVPVDALIKRGYEDIISIRIYGIGLEKKVKIPEGTKVYEIAPRVSLGNILEFDSKKSKRNIKIGYLDAKRLLYGLAGTIYYIDLEKDETECLIDFMVLGKDEFDEEGSSFRNLFEWYLPGLASDFKLESNWSYKDLYIALLEASAKILKVQKYKIYTDRELLWEIRAKWNQLDEKKQEELPDFVEKAAMIGTITKGLESQ